MRTFKDTFILCAVGGTLLLIALYFFFERAALDNTLGNVGSFIGQVIHALFIGAVMIFVTCFCCGVIWLYIKLRREMSYQIIRPDRHGNKAQAVIDRTGQIVPLFDIDSLTDYVRAFKGQFKMIDAGPAYDAIDGPANPLLLASGGRIDIPQIKLSEAVRKLTRNALQVYWGRKEDGTDCILDLPGSTHTQKSGMTGLGKSYLTLTELYCLHTMNDPEVIQFAYIDLENETTERFHSAPHTWNYVTKNASGRPEVRPAVAVELDSVLTILNAVNQELAYRDSHKSDPFPYLLVVIEEAEELIDALDELPKADQKSIMRLWKRIARRGRKRKILLDINVQNTYTDPIMRTAQRQFQLKITAAQQPTTAKSGGFQDLEKLKQLFDMKAKGLFIVNHETGEYFIMTPLIDVDMPDFEDPQIVDSEPEDGDPRQGWIENDIQRFQTVDTDWSDQPENAQKTYTKRSMTTVVNTPAPDLIDQPLERVPVFGSPTAETAGTTSEPAGKYQFSAVEKPIVIKLYKKLGTIDAVLETFERGSRWHASASAILRQEGLIK